MNLYTKLNLEKSARQVDQFFYPFGNSVGLNFFVFLRIYNNGKIIRFCNNFEWSKKYYLDKLYNQTDFYKSHIELVPEQKEEVFLWQAQPETVIYSSFYNYGIWHGLSVYQRNENYVESYSVATRPDNNQIYSFYFNYLDEIKNFAQAFRNNFFNSNVNFSKSFSSILKPNEYGPKESSQIFFNN